MNINVQVPRSGTKARSAIEIAFYRQCRTWHGYVSAVAFMALMFFSATGILLNHPDWIARDSGQPVLQSLQLESAGVAVALKAKDPGLALAQIVARKTSLRGAYASADIDTSEAILRFEGVTGNSNVAIDLKSAMAQVSIRRSDAATMLDDLHRGKNAGAVWKAFIDIAGALILALSMLGYVLFFSLRFRLRTSLILTGGSLALIIGAFALFVP